MLALLFLVVHATSSSIFSSVYIQIIAGVVVVAVTTATSAMVSRVRTRHAEKKKEDQSVLEQVAAFGKLVTDMHVALIGAEATPLDPSPPPGLVKRVAAIDDRTTKIEHTLFTNGDRHNTILDRLGRIEERTVVGSDPTQAILVAQSDQEDARKVRDNES